MLICRMMISEKYISYILIVIFHQKIKYLPANRIFMFYPSGLIACYSHVTLRDLGQGGGEGQYIPSPLGKLFAW